MPAPPPAGCPDGEPALAYLVLCTLLESEDLRPVRGGGSLRNWTCPSSLPKITCGRYRKLRNGAMGCGGMPYGWGIGGRICGNPG